ncbi:hypothetical protein [Halanaerobaculum tunisiense]
MLTRIKNQLSNTRQQEPKKDNLYSTLLLTFAGAFLLGKALNWMKKR